MTRDRRQLVAQREEGLARLHRLSIGAVVASAAAVGLFAVVGAASIPGRADTTQAQPASGDTQSSDGGLQPPADAPGGFGGFGGGMVTSGGS